MYTVWFSGNKDKDKVKQDFAVAYEAFKRLTEILNKKLKKSSEADYTIASWAYAQADVNGYNRALTEVMKLIKED